MEQPLGGANQSCRWYPGKASYKYLRTLGWSLAQSTRLMSPVQDNKRIDHCKLLPAKAGHSGQINCVEKGSSNDSKTD